MTDFYALRRYHRPGPSVIEQVDEDAMYEPERRETLQNIAISLLSIGMSCLIVWVSCWVGVHVFHAFCKAVSLFLQKVGLGG